MDILLIGELFVPSAYILINTEIGFEDRVLKELKKISNVKEAYVTYGVYDVIARVYAESMDELKEIISANIRHLDKVRSTLTMITIGEK